MANITQINGNLINAATASFASTASLLLGSVTSASFASTASFINTLNQNLTITGSLTLTNNLTVFGTASITTISQSTLNIGTNLITVNTNTPSTRFGGLAVIDSGSSPQLSGSILFDSTNNQWVFVHQNTGVGVTSSVFIQGPQTFNNIGNETNLTTNRLPKSTNAEHIGDSSITDNGVIVSINSNTEITGSLVASGGFSITTAASLLTSASIPSVNWGTRRLINSTNTTVLDWSGVPSLAGTSSWAQSASQAITSSFALTSSFLNPGTYLITASWAQSASQALSSSRAITSSFALTASLLLGSITSASFASTSSFVNTLNQSVIITGSAVIGSSSLGPSENTLTLGARDAVNEGGQLGFNAPGGTYTSASFLDHYQNRFRLLRGTNASSTSEVASWNLQTLQMSLPAYTSATAFPGTEVAMLGVDSGGTMLTTSLLGSTIFGNYAGTGFTHPVVTYLPFGTTTVSGTESQRQIASPFTGLLKNVYIRTNGAAAASSYTTFIIRVNGVSTNIQINISGGQAAGLYSNTINSASVALGAEISLQVSTSVANGPQVNQYSFGIYPS